MEIHGRMKHACRGPCNPCCYGRPGSGRPCILAVHLASMETLSTPSNPWRSAWSCLLPEKARRKRRVRIEALAREAERAAEHFAEQRKPRSVFFKAWPTSTSLPQLREPAQETLKVHSGLGQGMIQVSIPQMAVPQTPVSHLQSEGGPAATQRIPAPCHVEMGRLSFDPFDNNGSAHSGPDSPTQFMSGDSEALAATQQGSHDAESGLQGPPSSAEDFGGPCGEVLQSSAQRESPSKLGGAARHPPLSKEGKSGPLVFADQNTSGQLWAPSLSTGGLRSSGLTSSPEAPGATQQGGHEPGSGLQTPPFCAGRESPGRPGVSPLQPCLSREGKSDTFSFLVRSSASLWAPSPSRDASRSSGPSSSPEAISMAKPRAPPLPGPSQEGTAVCQAGTQHLGRPELQQKRKAGEGGGRALACKVARHSEAHKEVHGGAGVIGETAVRLVETNQNLSAARQSLTVPCAAQPDGAVGGSGGQSVSRQKLLPGILGGHAPKIVPANITRTKAVPRRLPGRTGYYGVTMERGRFRAYIALKGKPCYLGVFQDPVSAARRYNIAATDAFGAAAVLNVLPGE